MPAGATSLLAVGEWIADAPGYVLEQVGADPDPLLPRRVLPAETTVRRQLARIDGDALDRAVGRWLADRHPKATGLLRHQRAVQEALLVCAEHPAITQSGLPFDQQTARSVRQQPLTQDAHDHLKHEPALVSSDRGHPRSPARTAHDRLRQDTRDKELAWLEGLGGPRRRGDLPGV
ncbi:hypothetical protein [Streptomyces mirabilis]